MKDFKSLRIVFMGTPEFAVSSLDALIKAGANIVGVVTAPDKPAGRGLQLQQSAVKKYAVENNLHLLQPVKLKDPTFLEELSNCKADLQIVVAFRMLPESVWNLPPIGTINLHGSLLPKYRGAAPINWAIINGEKETGVTTFKLKHEIDTGNILMQEVIPIAENETAGTLHDKMKIVGANLLVKTIQALASNSLQEEAQPVFNESAEFPHAPKLNPDNTSIDCNKTAIEVNQLIKGLNPFPVAHTKLHGKFCKIYAATVEDTGANNNPGQWTTDGKKWLKLSCKEGSISITELQLEGKKRMPIEDFLRGYRFPENQ
jgi:methionyl-tRNA formyltransferase